MAITGYLPGSKVPGARRGPLHPRRQRSLQDYEAAAGQPPIPATRGRPARMAIGSKAGMLPNVMLRLLRVQADDRGAPRHRPPPGLSGFGGAAGGEAHEVGVEVDGELGAARAAVLVLVALPGLVLDRAGEAAFH